MRIRKKQSDYKGDTTMIKAVSKQILEVTETGNEYFEHAWLMVKPELANLEASRIAEEAEQYMRGLDAPAAVKRRGIRIWAMRVAGFLASAGLGAIVMKMI